MTSRRWLTAAAFDMQLVSHMISSYYCSAVDTVAVGGVTESENTFRYGKRDQTVMAGQKQALPRKKPMLMKINLECLQLFIATVTVQVFGNPFAYHSVTTHNLSLKSACPVMQEIQYLCGLAVLYNPRERL